MKGIKKLFFTTVLCFVIVYALWAVITQSPPYIKINGESYFAYARSLDFTADFQNTDTHQLEPLGHMKFLRELRIKDIREAGDLDFLKNMSRLENLTLDGHYKTVIYDYSALGSCTRLKSFSSGYININDLSVFKDMKELERLNLCMYGENIEGRDVTDLTPIADLTELKLLYLQCEGLTDISALSGLTELENVMLYKSSISDLEPLRYHGKLKYLLISNDEQLTDITVLESCAALEMLWINGTNVTDISPLFDLENLRTVYLDKEKVPADQIRELKSKGVSINETQRT